MSRIECKYLEDKKCLLASDISQSDCPVLVEQCDYCTNKADPPQSVNVVTISLAMKYSKDTKRIVQQYGQVISDKAPTHGQSPGTELRKLIAWFVWDKRVKNCSTCKNREERMNRWGADKCEENIATIIEWLRESATERGYPFSPRVASALIRKAIANSRR